MSSSDPYTFLKTLITKEEAESRGRRTPAPPARVITLSRDFGARGGTIGHKLANTLGIPLIDREILDRIAAKTRVAAFKLKGHDEDIAAGISTFLFSLLTGTAGELDTYRRALHEVILELGKTDCLIIGRGAHLILGGRRAFRVRIVGSRSVCAKRVADDEGISLAEAERRVFEINNKRNKSVQMLFRDSVENVSLEHASDFDLVLNTDHISPDAAVPVILLGMQQAGFPLQTTAKS